MSEPKFTPGPWIVCPDVGLQIPVASVAKEGLKRNVSHVAGIRNGEGAANAHLIAAAPELYEALEKIRHWGESQHKAQSKGGHKTFDMMMLREQIDIAEAALAKARGEG